MKGYEIRTCYINFAEHLQNSWNVNFMYENAPGEWGETEWTAFLKQIKTFGFNNFEFWIPPTICKPGPERDRATSNLRMLVRLCHENGLMATVLMAINTIGAEWFFACPNVPEERERILEFWRYYAEQLPDADIFSIFPGDPGGCNRNGCNHNTFIELAAEIANMIKTMNPGAMFEIGTWGTPFTGWGEDMRATPGWDGSFEMLIDPNVNNPEIPCHIWNGPPERVPVAMNDFIDRLHLFPEGTMFSLNSGFNPDAIPTGAYDARPYVKEIAKKYKVTSWDYAASEGELICYPHYRGKKYQRQRMTEMQTAHYTGAICYTMSPKLSQMMLYTAAQLMINPEEDPVKISSRFTELVFGDCKIGPLMEAFEIVEGWGFEGTPYTKEELIKMLEELVVLLENSIGNECRLPIYPSVDDYRDDLIWHAKNFIEMLGENPDREAIRKAYWEKAMSIYDVIPRSVDERASSSSRGYSKIGIELVKEFKPCFS